MSSSIPPSAPVVYECPYCDAMFKGFPSFPWEELEPHIREKHTHTFEMEALGE